MEIHCRQISNFPHANLSFHFISHKLLEAFTCAYFKFHQKQNLSFLNVLLMPWDSFQEAKRELLMNAAALTQKSPHLLELCLVWQAMWSIKSPQTIISKVKCRRSIFVETNLPFPFFLCFIIFYLISLTGRGESGGGNGRKGERKEEQCSHRQRMDWADAGIRQQSRSPKWVAETQALNDHLLAPGMYVSRNKKWT